MPHAPRRTGAPWRHGRRRSARYRGLHPLAVPHSGATAPRSSATSRYRPGRRSTRPTSMPGSPRSARRRSRNSGSTASSSRHACCGSRTPPDGSRRPTSGTTARRRRPSTPRRSQCCSTRATRSRPRRTAASATTEGRTRSSGSRRWHSRCRPQRVSRWLTLSELARSGALSNPPAETSITFADDPSGLAVSALGYLHANCGMPCHSTRGLGDETQLVLRLRAG